MVGAPLTKCYVVQGNPLIKKAELCQANERKGLDKSLVFGKFTGSIIFGNLVAYKNR